nr:Flp pilus assembly protein CpaB [Sphingobium nicotianae]
MSNQRNFVILLIALLMGVFAVYLANSYFTGVARHNEKIAEDLNLATIVAARVPLNYGDQITADKLKVVQWPSSSVPEGSFNDIRALLSDPAGPRVTLRPIEAGVPVLRPMISGPGGRAVISATLSRDKRAVAIRVNEASGVGGFVAPGDSVDVLLTRQPPASGASAAEQITDTIVENVRVIATDQNANDASKDPQVSKTVTLEVDPIQAQKIALAGQIGQLSLSLRNVADRKPAETRTVTVADLGSGGYPYYTPAPAAAAAPAYHRAPAAPRAAAPARPSGPAVIVGKGLSISKVEVSRDGGN